MQSTPFMACLEHVLRAEGGYVDNPRDPGGATNMGITRKTLAAWRGVAPWWHLPKSAVSALGRAEAARIYFARYWQPAAAGQMPHGLDLAVFDFAVHSGPRRAVMTLQALLDVRQDAVVGPKTRAAIALKAGQKELAGLIKAYFRARLNFLKSLPTYRHFAKGWQARIRQMRAQSLAMNAARASGSSPEKPFSQDSLSKKRTHKMDILPGYKTYIVGVLMLLTALAQMAGIDVPGMQMQSSAQLLMQALGLIFLRRGIASSN